MGTGSFPGVKRPSSAEVKEGVKLCLYPVWDFVACYRVNFTFSFIPYKNLSRLSIKYPLWHYVAKDVTPVEGVKR
jgi:hypothetical protein